MACLILVMGLWSCSSDDPEVTPTNNGNNGNNGGNNGNVNQNADPEKITRGLLLKNAEIKTGAMPENGTVHDLKISMDTIFWVNGIQNRIRFRKPADIVLGSVSMQVEGSNSYITAEFEETEESDTVAVLYFDFDPQDLDLPLKFNLKIVPNDDNGNGTDVINKPVVIEKENASGCDLDLENTHWEWIVTTMNGGFELGPMYQQSTVGSVIGCCTNGQSEYANCPDASNNKSVDYKTVFMVEREFIKFFNGNDFVGELYLFTQNVRPSESNFCNGTPGYTRSKTYSPFTGKHSFNEANCTINLTDIEGETDPLFTDSGVYLGDFPRPVYIVGTPYAEYKFISKHFLKESRGGESTGLSRYFMRNDSGELWYD